MDIDRIMMVWDGNPFYEGFYEMQRALWGKQGVETGLVFVSDGGNARMIPKTGDVRVVEDRSTVPFTPPPGRNWKATMALIHGPRLFPGEVVYVTGMDQFPASRRYLDLVEPVPKDELVVCFGDRGHISTGYLVAHHDVWTEVMKPTPTDFTELIEWTWKLGLDTRDFGDIATGWGNDEFLLVKLIRECEGLKLRSLFNPENHRPDWLDRVLGITQIAPDMGKLKAGFYSELHIRLPMSDMDRQTFDVLLAMDRLP